MAVPQQRVERFNWAIQTANNLDFPVTLVGLLTVGTLALDLGGAPDWLIVGAAALCLLACFGQAWNLSRDASSSDNAILGQTTTCRLVLALALTWLVPAFSGRLWAFIGIAIATVLEPIMRRLNPISETMVAGLPGLPLHRSLGIPVKLHAWLNTAVLVTFLPAVWWEPGRLVMLIACLATLILTLIQLVDTSLGVMARHRQGHGLVKALQKIKPKFALYWIAAPETAYQVSMWLPYLERLNEPFVIIVRSRVNFEDVRALTKRPIVICRYQDDLDSVVVPSLRAVFYTNNSPRNMHMVRFPGIKHIQLNHGDSDKAPSFNPVFRMYDKNFVAGQAAIDRFAANGVEMQRDDFVIVGRPQVENVNVVDTPISDVANPTVLYAPTWYGFNADSRYSSLAVGPLLIEALLRRGVNVIFRPHPYARRTATYAAAIERIYNLLSTDPRPNSTHVFGKKAETEWSVFDCFNAADAMISDVSSVVNDFLYSGKPIAMMAVDVPAAEFPEVFPVAKACYIIEARSDQLVDVETPINRLLGTDPLRSQRLSLRTHYLGDFPSDGYANHFLQAALEQIQ